MNLQLYSDCKLLEESLFVLANIEDKDQKLKAAADIRAHVEAAARELSLERFANFENELYQRILLFVNSTTLDGGVQVGGILAIRELVDSTSTIAESKLNRFGSALSTAMSNSTNFSLIEIIADSLGHMARYAKLRQPSIKSCPTSIIHQHK